MRLHQVAYATQAHKDTGRAVDARSLSDIAGFAPTTLHALGVRVSTEVMRKQHDLLVTNVPGPQVPLYAAGARLVGELPGAAAVRRAPADHRRDVLRRRRVLRADRRPRRDPRSRRAGPVPARRPGGAAGHHRAAARSRQPTRKATPAARRAAAKKSAARQEAALGRRPGRSAPRYGTWWPAPARRRPPEPPARCGDEPRRKAATSEEGHDEPEEGPGEEGRHGEEGRGQEGRATKKAPAKSRRPSADDRRWSSSRSTGPTPSRCGPAPIWSAARLCADGRSGRRARPGRAAPRRSSSPPSAMPASLRCQRPPTRGAWCWPPRSIRPGDDSGDDSVR